LNVPVMDVDSLWVRGNSWKTGAVVGSMLGAVAGAVVLGAGRSLCESSSDCTASTGAGGAVGGLGGLVANGLNRGRSSALFSEVAQSMAVSLARVCRGDS
jgi:hypothetical protein